MFQSVIWRLGWRYINRRFLQSVLFVLGVALGVAIVIAIDLANTSASRAFELSTESITGKATHQIIGGASGIPTQLYQDLRIEAGIQTAAPVLTEYVRATEFGDQPLRLLGVDPFAEPPFRDYLTTIEITSGSTDTFAALTNFITQPNTVLISQPLANRYSVQVGDTINIRTETATIDVTVVGVLQPTDTVSQQALDDLLLTDIATAQELLGVSDRITRIDLILSDIQAGNVQEALPIGVTLVRTTDQSSALSQMTDAFEINLQALSLLAVVVGMFLIYNTVMFSVVRRRPVIGILRAIGATKRQIFALILGEAVILGVIGTLIGLGLGLLFGRVTVGLVSQTIQDLYFSVTVQRVVLDSSSISKGIALGIVASIIAAVVPSFDATRTAPMGSMRRSDLEERTQRRMPIIVIGAICFAVLAWVILLLPTQNLIISFMALFCVILAGALLTPVAMLVFMRWITPITSSLFGVIGRMAPRSINRTLSRTSVAVAALAISVSVIIGVSVMIGSFRSTVQDWLDTTLQADIFISPPLLSATGNTVDVDPSIREQVANTPGVAEVAASRSVSVIAPDYPDLPPVNLIAVDADISQGGRQFIWQEEGSWDEAFAAGQIAVSEPFAFRRGITPEKNTITLLTDQGEQIFTVFGVYYDYSTDQGNVLILRSYYDNYYDDEYVSTIAAFVSLDTDLASVIETLKQDTLIGTDLVVQSNRDLRNGVFEVFDRTFAITVALRVLATVVAFIGILSALVALQLEHTREYAVMQSNGMTPNQLQQYTFLQTGLMGIVAGTLAIPIGLVLAIVLIQVINVRSFGWTMQFFIPPNEVLEAFLVAVVAALLAGIYPAFRLRRLSLSTALKFD